MIIDLIAEPKVTRSTDTVCAAWVAFAKQLQAGQLVRTRYRLIELFAEPKVA